MEPAAVVGGDVGDERIESKMPGRQARGQRGARVHHQERAGAKEAGEVAEAGVLVPLGRRDQQAHLVALQAAALRGAGRLERPWTLEFELGALHTAASANAASAGTFTSQRSDCA